MKKINEEKLVKYLRSLIFRSLKKRKKLGGPNKTCQWAGFNLGLPVRTRLSQQMALEWPGKSL